jgi:hypothetical protein
LVVAPGLDWEATEAVVSQVVFPSQLLSGYGGRYCLSLLAIELLGPIGRLRQEHVEGVDVTFGRVTVTVVTVFVASRAARAA